MHTKWILPFFNQQKCPHTEQFRMPQFIRSQTSHTHKCDTNAKVGCLLLYRLILFSQHNFIYISHLVFWHVASTFSSPCTTSLSKLLRVRWKIFQRQISFSGTSNRIRSITKYAILVFLSHNIGICSLPLWPVLHIVKFLSILIITPAINELERLRANKSACTHTALHSKVLFYMYLYEWNEYIFVQCILFTVQCCCCYCFWFLQISIFKLMWIKFIWQLWLSLHWTRISYAWHLEYENSLNIYCVHYI